MDHQDLRAFYRLAAVRERFAEYLGGPSLGDATAVYVSSPSHPPAEQTSRLTPTRLPDLLATELEAARSLWDRRSLLAHLDLEHVHFDRPWEPVTDQPRSRRLQRPIVAVVRGILDQHHVPHLRILTGRGQHFVWRVDRDSSTFSALARLGSPGEALRAAYRQPVPEVEGLAVDEQLGSAYDGLGRVLEHLGHRVLERSGSSVVPVQLAAVVVGPGPGGREIVSLDLSQFGDPLHCRRIRLPFTAYRKVERMKLPVAADPLPFIVVPVTDGGEQRVRRAARSLELAAELAAESRVEIPDGSDGTEGLLEAYLESDLHRFHRRYEKVLPEPPERWRETYDRLDLGSLPGCLRRILGHPNDLLLQPAAIQHVVRGLTALGWAPRHVAGLIRSKYEGEYGWLEGVHFHDAWVRADFYTRLFAGLIACGRDTMVDFNCRSADEKGLCTREECGWDLRELRARLVSGSATG